MANPTSPTPLATTATAATEATAESKHHHEDKYWKTILPLPLGILPATSEGSINYKLNSFAHHSVQSDYLYRSDRYPTLRYPLTEHLCTKGLWFPIATSITKATVQRLHDKFSHAAKMASEPKTKPKQEAEQVGLKVCLMATQSLFEDRGSLPERTFEKVMDSTKKILGRTQRDAGVRSVISYLPIQPVYSRFHSAFALYSSASVLFVGIVHPCILGVAVRIVYSRYECLVFGSVESDVSNVDVSLR